MTWLRENDVSYDEPLVLAVGNAAYGAWMRMKLYASVHTDGWLPEQKALEIASRAELRKLLTVFPDLGALLHRHGDPCPCLEPHTWSAERGGFWIHDFLKLNPSKAEVDVERAKKKELRNPALKHSVRVRDADRCRYCGKHCSHSDRVSDDGLTFDHIDPAMAGGMDNLVVACRGCNNRKGRRTPAQADMELLPAPTSAPVTAAGPDVGLDTATGPGLSQDQVQVTGGAQVSSSPGRDGAGHGPGTPGVIGPANTPRQPGDSNPYLRQQIPKAGIPAGEIPGEMDIQDVIGAPA